MDDVVSVILLLALWGALNLFAVALAMVARAQLTAPVLSGAERDAIHEEEEEILDALDVLYETDHKHPPPPHVMWP